MSKAISRARFRPLRNGPEAAGPRSAGLQAAAPAAGPALTLPGQSGGRSTTDPSAYVTATSLCPHPESSASGPRVTCELPDCTRVASLPVHGLPRAHLLQPGTARTMQFCRGLRTYRHENRAGNSQLPMDFELTGPSQPVGMCTTYKHCDICVWKGCHGVWGAVGYQD